MSSIAAFIASTRFGFGPKNGELSTISADPRGWLEAQLNPKYAQNSAFSGLKSTNQAVQEMRGFLKQKRNLKKEGEESRDMLKEMVKEQTKEYLGDIARRTRVAAASETPFFERLVQFWSNHFTVSSTKRQEMMVLADFEREAIRPNIMGSFHDMLLASTRHPAMLIYLDNFQSIGPHSIGGRLKSKGLNENLAREIMELHTLGVNGGYTQNDVTEFAKILTGWTLDRNGNSESNGFKFARMIHEPGPKTLLGETYPENGINEGERALATFAAHPATAKFIATKLARHFIADDPPDSAVDALAEAFTRNNGALLPVYQTLLSLDETWADPLSKVKTPNDYIMSLLRISDADVDDMHIAGAYKKLGQMPFSAPSPAGWSDMAKDWVGAEALLQRIEVAQLVASGIHARTNPADLMEQTIGPVASAETKFAVTRAGSTEEAITLLFSSPEFQRR